MLGSAGVEPNAKRCEVSLFEFFARAWREVDPAPFE
jgi:hypothetical protein